MLNRGSGQPGGVTLEEQLTLAKEKISNAQQQGAYGSGTAMFGTNLDNTVLMIIVITVIIGGVVLHSLLQVELVVRRNSWL